MKNKKSTILNDFTHKQAYTDLVQNRLFSYLWDFFFKPMFKIMKVKPIAENEENILLDAIKNGEIYYIDGGFKSDKKFSNKISQELIRLGAKYDKFNKIYLIDKSLLPTTIIKYIDKSQKMAKIKLEEINQFLQDIQNNLDTYIDLMVFDTEVRTILDDAGNEIKQNIKHINVIEPELTQEQFEQIEQAYTKNMQYYVKNWTVQRIAKMREKVHKAILEGFREEQVQKMLQTEYGIEQHKAKFLAHNETSIMLAEYKKATYTAMGFDKFIWKTRLDGRERLEHHKLNGKIFRFDEPPIIDEHTGQRGLPGETYNCRCLLLPYRDDNIFNDIIGNNDNNNDSNYYKKVEDKHKLQFKDSLVKQRLYHGSPNVFKEFQDQGSYFFSDNKNVAKSYKGSKTKGNIYNAYLDIKNPYTISANGQSFNKISNRTTDQIAEEVKRYGYDSLIIHDVVDSGPIPNKSSIEPHTDYIVFDKKQIRIVEDDI